MSAYPIILCLAKRKCTVIGGGAVAERKIGDLLAAGACVTVISPMVTDAISQWSASGRLTHVPRPYQSGDMGDCFLLICATDNKTVNEAAAGEARARGILVNVVDAPELCDFTVPSKICRGDLLLTISTGGHSPALAKKLRIELENTYGPEYGLWLELAGKLRDELKAALPSSKAREEFWQRAVDKDILSLLQSGKLSEAEDKIRHAISCIGPQP